jgi:hypothetical protein
VGTSSSRITKMRKIISELTHRADSLRKKRDLEDAIAIPATSQSPFDHFDTIFKSWTVEVGG